MKNLPRNSRNSAAESGRISLRDSLKQRPLSSVPAHTQPSTRPSDTQQVGFSFKKKKKEKKGRRRRGSRAQSYSFVKEILVPGRFPLTSERASGHEWVGEADPESAQRKTSDIRSAKLSRVLLFPFNCLKNKEVTIRSALNKPLKKNHTH